MKHVPSNVAASQTEHPWRATARTLIQSILGAGGAVLGILIFVPGAMDELAAALGEVGIVVPAVLIALPPVIARIMAIPGVESALRGIGLGAAPKVEPVPDPDESPVEEPADDAEDADLEEMAADEVDLTPPPAGYEPRH